MIIIKYCVLRAFPTLNVRNCNSFSLLFTFLADFLKNQALNKKKIFSYKVVVILLDYVPTIRCLYYIFIVNTYLIISEI
jgi:hypothetical protein